MRKNPPASQNMGSSSERTETYVALLRAFESELDQVTLRNGVAIRPLQWGIDADDDTRFAGLFDPDNAFVMECRVVGDVEPNEPFDAFNNTVTAMRLTGPGAVSLGDLLKPRNMMIRAPAFGVRPYRLTEEHLESLNRVAIALAEVHRDSSIRRAISRFNLAYDRTELFVDRDELRAQLEDKFIDYWIALETLFLPDEPAQELRYRVSLRVAYFVGRSGHERREMFRRIRESYDARSKVVHGRPMPRNLQKIADHTENALRRALSQAVQTPELLDTRRLDDLIVMGRRTRQE